MVQSLMKKQLEQKEATDGTSLAIEENPPATYLAFPWRNLGVYIRHTKKMLKTSLILKQNGCQMMSMSNAIQIYSND